MFRFEAHGRLVVSLRDVGFGHHRSQRAVAESLGEVMGRFDGKVILVIGPRCSNGGTIPG